MISGLLVVDKLAGMTSHDVVARARRAIGEKRIGHAGTLDPMATGVLVLGVGQATRLIRYVQDQHKEYVARVQFGIATSTLDADGTEIERAPMSISEVQLAAALAAFTGEISQVPPMVSALKHQGRRLYEIARSGEEVDREPRRVTIQELELLTFEEGEFPIAVFRLVCSKGTYVRTLADDVARSLGGRAHLKALRRTRVGPFHHAQAITDLGDWPGHLLDPAAAVTHLDHWRASEEEATAVRHGRRLPVPNQGGPWAVVDRDSRLLAVYKRRGSEAVAEVVLA